MNAKRYSMHRVLISLIALPVMVFANAQCARAAVYTLDSVFGGMFAISDAFFPADTEAHGPISWTNPVSLSETRFADSFAGFGWATAESNLNYSTTSTTITGSGSVINQAFLDSADGVASHTESFIDVLFTVPVPTLYQLDATVTQSLNGNASTVVTQVIAWDWAMGATGFAGSAMTNQTISQTGTLSPAPAQYRLQGFVKILDSLGPSSGILSIDSSATYEFELMLTPIPEPSTLLLLGIGMLGVLGYATRRPRSRA